jgi:3-deoxy-manno-octulosonate cytidylyltransferase (CMP-KDO synthetase)
MSVLGVIPARYGSTRFPGKLLAEIAGRPLIQHVYERAVQSTALDDLVVATDDERIHDCISSIGGQVIMTRADHPSGTDRIAEVAERMIHGHYVNIQGDEPLIQAEAIDMLVAHSLKRGAPMSTLVRALHPEADREVLADPNVVKVAKAQDGAALYFSRAPIPFARHPEHAHHYKHIGVYMYARETLLTLQQLQPTPLELAEGLEQLRALEHGISIFVVETDYNPIGVDVPADIAAVETELRNQA